MVGSGFQVIAKIGDSHLQEIAFLPPLFAAFFAAK